MQSTPQPEDVETPGAACDAPPRHSPARDDGDPLRELAGSLAELQSQARLFASAKVDQLRVGIRNRVVTIFAFAAVGIVGLVVIITAAVYVVHGIALGLAGAFGGRLWLGYLVCGVLILVLTVSGAVMAEFVARARARRALEEKYEQNPPDRAADFDGQAQ